MDLDGPDGLADVRLPIVVITVLGIVTIQVIVVCVWRLLTMVARGTVFSHAAFRYVDVMFGAAVGRVAARRSRSASCSRRARPSPRASSC